MRTVKNGVLEQKDGETLMEVYQAFDIDGMPRRRLVADELVTLFGVAQGIKKGEIQTIEVLKVERIGRAQKNRRRKQCRTIRLREKKGAR